jgi:predicted metal-binding transcription factor (methanogenesis marker protein 9)
MVMLFMTTFNWLRDARHAHYATKLAWCAKRSKACLMRDFVTSNSNDKPRIVAYRNNIEASIDVSYRHVQAVAQCKP